jgi:hypothetical protein
VTPFAMSISPALNIGSKVNSSNVQRPISPP